ncbi:hypothetical protein NQ315_016314 [Exocentrus adspersus]|uniref:PHD finger protein 20 n=1 Tax=Exocentrus adspersus TaxID=1586481 RepID=A0AAV8VQN6_9CUCU|nr:hypothetical protein NQ315_016314 [Exocentrus adspersus]
MGRKCSVEGCLSDSNRPEDMGVTFHKVPMHSDVRPKWMSLCRIPEDKKLIKIIYVCSRHFLRADFCNFKDIKTEIKLEPEDVPMDETESQCPVLENQLKVELKEKVDEFDNSKAGQNTTGPVINFTINSRIEALDFNNEWYPARIVEVDYEENEVLIHFEKFSSKYDEWICMNSSRLRPLQTTKKTVESYLVGERCMAAWSDARKFPATITKIMENDTYEVLFDDGFVKTLKAHRMSKAHGRMQSSPLFDPIKSSKQDRRDKKRKLNVAALFRKRPKLENAEQKIKKSPASPAPVEETITTTTSTSDVSIDMNWTPHPDGRRFRSKWDVRNYIEQNPTLALNEQMFDFSLVAKRQKKSSSGSNAKKVTVLPPPPPPELKPPPELVAVKEEVPPPDLSNDEENNQSLRILFEDDAYKCPIEGCGKTFRRENLAQMHVKHYHPEYTKFLDSTPNVADLAYARTVGENLDKSPGPTKSSSLSKQGVRTSTPKFQKLPQSPLCEPSELKPLVDPQSPAVTKGKDAEIIKLLNAKPSDSNKDTENIQALPPGLPTDMYPDIKLKDLLNKADAVPKHDEISLKTLCTTRPPAGIKTLLPVVRPSNADSNVEDTPKATTIGKRKRGAVENVEVIRGKENQPATVTTPTSHPPAPTQPPPPPSSTPDPQSPQHPPPPNDIIIEGGEVIKIVRMRQEEIINCTCGFTEEDGLMIQCELCLCWQHAYCNNIERESQVPEKYVCYICQHPLRERTSRKYYHDQDWLKQGVMPTGSYHSRDEETVLKRFEKLKKCHDLSGGLLELRDYMHSLKIKMKIAEAKNHPKLYLWSKSWEKLLLPEKAKQEPEDIKPKVENDHQYIKNELDMEKQEPQSDSMLMMILKAGKDVIPKLDLMSSLMESSIAPSAPIIPQPEAAIDSADCRLNLLEHIIHQESLVEERLDEFEKQIVALEEGMNNLEADPNYPKTRQTLEMLIRDLSVLKEFSQSTTI